MTQDSTTLTPMTLIAAGFLGGLLGFSLRGNRIVRLRMESLAASARSLSRRSGSGLMNESAKEAGLASSEATSTTQQLERDPSQDESNQPTKRRRQGQAAESTTTKAGQYSKELMQEEHKMVMVARMDLKMSAGKIAAQCCHACLGATLIAKKETPVFYQNWLYRDAQAKVVVKSPDLSEIEVAQEKAIQLGVPNYLVHDAGRTQIAAGSATVLAVGPAPASLVNQNTERMSITEPAFRFKYLPEAKFPAFHDKETNELFAKWALQNQAIAKFQYDEYFQKYQSKDFLRDFFNSRDVIGVIRSVFAGAHPNGGDIEYTELSATTTNMNFFDKMLTKKELIRPSGHIVRMVDTPINGYMCCNRLQEMLITDESEFYSLFSEEEKDELIFHIMKSLVLGGNLSQYEDVIQPYLDTSKKLYKDLASVQKSSGTGKVEVVSYAYKVTGFPNGMLFGKNAVQNFCYVTVDPIMRTVNLWYFPFTDIW